MLGAIVGDIVGSRFEDRRRNHRSKDFEFFADRCRVTDDSIMTLAIAKAIMDTTSLIRPRENCEIFYTELSRLTVQNMQRIGRQYPHCGFGGGFRRWVASDHPEPYNSYGNGAAMRVSPAGFSANTLEDAIARSEAVTRVTHNHPEGIKGANATTTAIFMARSGAAKSQIGKQISEKYYPLDFKIDDIRETYHFDVSCQGTVPQAIQCFLESVSFEDAIRNAISIGGDSDTIAAITGGIAEAYYGIPEDIKKEAFKYLDDELLAIYDRWVAFTPPGMIHNLK